ncbi:uncharacterized protein LOC124255223 [Haliotis rubra]|uniref:uncharacterized protein LOC124255223 n=1 Tax=Haliotis rubra TaxID=36100 RepID=UPI001EE5D63C|nr:uncharacterized protein LOC124255223 [Haliotis rubra]XP_046545023.1 uncharacterized protein LOC124255223 [Haliotis rubra]
MDEDRLKDFPNSFQLEEFVSLRQRRCRAAIKNCTKETFDSEFEEMRNENFLTLLLFKLGDTEEALKMNQRALLKGPNNIVALANRVYIKSWLGYGIDADVSFERLEKLRQSSSFGTLYDSALGEKAYSYTRMGPRFYHRAIDLFEDVIKRHPEDYLLIFGLALTYRRCLSQYIFSVNPVQDIGDSITRAINLMVTVVQNCKASDLVGKSYIQLGELYKMLDDCEYPLNKEVVSRVNVKRIMSPSDCYKKAYEVANNWFVLERAGQYFRKLGENRLAVDLLTKALKKRQGSTFAHYQLAMLYKAKIKPKNSNVLSTCMKEGARSSISSGFRGNENDETPGTDAHNSYTEDALDQALYHTKRSIQISNGSNTKAVYELGMLNIMMGRTQDALEQFRKLIQKDQPYALPFEKANAYEQLGLCYRAMSVDRAYTEQDQNRFKTECQRMLTKAIEEAAKAVIEVPGMQSSNIFESWQCLPKLEELLLSDSEDSESMNSMKEVARLRGLMRKYRSSLAMYNKAMTLYPGHEAGVEVLEGIITSYLTLQEFENVLPTVYILQSTYSNTDISKRKEFCTNVFLECGLRFLEQCQQEYLKECFQNSFKTAYPVCSGQDSECFDVMILQEFESDCSDTEGLRSCMEYLGLRCTRNGDAVAAGSLEISGITSIIENSRTLIIYISMDTLSDTFSFYCQTAVTLARDNYKNICLSNIVIVTDSPCVPSWLNTYSCIEYRRIVDGKPQSSQDQKWIRELCSKLLNVKCPRH